MTNKHTEKEVIERWKKNPESKFYSPRGNKIIIDHILSERATAKQEVLKICEDIFWEGVDWSEWGMDENDAREKFKERLNEKGITLSNTQ